jgi:hypothetical protein
MFPINHDEVIRSRKNKKDVMLNPANGGTSETIKDLRDPETSSE